MTNPIHDLQMGDVVTFGGRDFVLVENAKQPGEMSMKNAIYLIREMDGILCGEPFDRITRDGEEIWQKGGEGE